jgi:hypothetical protein
MILRISGGIENDSDHRHPACALGVVPAFDIDAPRIASLSEDADDGRPEGKAHPLVCRALREGAEHLDEPSHGIRDGRADQPAGEAGDDGAVEQARGVDESLPPLPGLIVDRAAIQGVREGFETIEAHLRERARIEGRSLSQVASDLLAEASGLGCSNKKRDLSRFAGTWNAEEAEAFAVTQRPFSEIDAEIWT